MVEHLVYTERVGGSKPSQPTRILRGSYSGNTLAFQAKARSSILLPRSIIERTKMNIIQRVAQQAGITPNRTALIQKSNNISYKQLVDMVNRAAAFLKPLQDHDVVAIDFKDGIDSLVVRLACMQLGIVSAPISNKLPPEEILKRWQLIEATHIITDEFHDAFASFPQMCVPNLITQSESLPPLQEYTPGGDLPLFICWSGGTHGTPDALLHSHASMLEQVSNADQYWKPASIDNHVCYSVAPIPTSFFMFYTIICLAKGYTLVFEPTPFNPTTVANNIIQHKVEHFAATPPIYSILLRKKLLTPLNAPAINLIAGDAVSSQLVKEWESTLHQTMNTCLASSQTTAVIYREKDAPQDSLGKLLPYAEMRLLDENGNQVAPGQPGEAWYRSKQFAIADRTISGVSSIKDGWITSRDILRQDENGFIYFVGRSNDTFKINGLFVSPYSIEDRVRDIPGVEDAVVVPKADEHGVKRVKIYVVTQQGAYDKNEIERSIREMSNLASHERIRHVEFIDEVPRHPLNMKVQRAKLRV